MLVGFHLIEPEIATKTVQSIRVNPGSSIPPGEYAFLELYCPKPDCDCRRVSLMVVNDNSEGSCATVSHAFVGGDLGPNDEVTFLDPSHPAAPFAGELLEIAREMLSEGTAYEQRLQQHYAMVKRAVADPKHPCHARLAESESQPRPPKGSQLPPGSIGTERSPVCVSVQNDAQLAKVAAMAEELNIHYIARIAPQQPLDMRDFSRLGQMASAVPQNLSRHERRRWEKINTRKR